jgi:ABC-2 type transport system ATP-binding protein
MSESIVIDGLSKYYGNFLALDELTLHVEENENIGLLGPNGAGKSTTLKILTGLLKPSGGTVTVRGIDVAKHPEAALGTIGAIIETSEFYGFLTPEENLSYLGRLRGMNGRHLKERIKEVISIVKMDKWARVKIEKFSRGMKQRLALAQSLLHDPAVLILDEPALGLDPRGVVEFRQIIEAAGKTKTVFFASHQLSEVTLICDKVAFINDGKLLRYDTVGAITKEFGTLEEAYLKVTGAA